MSFKFYKNKKTKHPSISVKQRNKTKWFNMPLTHEKPKDSYIKVVDPHPKNKKKRISEQNYSYIRLYIRTDKKGIKGHPYREYKLTKKEEREIKEYLSRKYKKR